MTPAMTGAFGTAFVALLAWRVYRRTRRLIGQQRSRLWRHVTSVIVLPLLLALIGAGAWLANRDAALALAGGIATGVALAIWGLRLTRFEHNEHGWFYTPNARIGIALSALLVARIAWRLFELAPQIGTNMRGASQDAMRSPLTLLIIGTLLAYYAAYGAGLVRWRLREA